MSLRLLKPNNFAASEIGARFKWAICLWAGLLILAGCAGLGTPRDLLDQWPEQRHLADVPFHEQAALHCGPAALAMTLNWSGVDVGPDELAALVYTPGRQGSLQSEMITAARRHGRLAYPIHGQKCLFEALVSGQPVIVLQNLGLTWMPRWHYAVAVGYDLTDSKMILHTGKIANRRVGLKTFGRTWQRAHQWGLLVLPPGDMPVCAEQGPYLQAALGLQQAGHLIAAQTAFQAATRQWPLSTAAHMGLGNILYAGGEPGAALDTFRRVIQMDPDNADAFNNLAHILAEMESLSAAEAAARRAVQIGGPHQAIYRQTLAEILQRAGGASRSDP
jgi:hypothetical protein